MAFPGGQTVYSIPRIIAKRSIFICPVDNESGFRHPYSPDVRYEHHRLYSVALLHSTGYTALRKRGVCTSAPCWAAFDGPENHPEKKGATTFRRQLFFDTV